MNKTIEDKITAIKIWLQGSPTGEYYKLYEILFQLTKIYLENFKSNKRYDYIYEGINPKDTREESLKTYLFFIHLLPAVSPDVTVYISEGSSLPLNLITRDSINVRQLLFVSKLQLLKTCIPSTEILSLVNLEHELYTIDEYGYTNKSTSLEWKLYKKLKSNEL